MKTILLELLNQLDTIGAEHEELYDSEVRERMGNALMEGFVRQRIDSSLPDDFGMFSDAANRQFKHAIKSYLAKASEKARELGLLQFHARLAALQNSEVRSTVEENDYDELFGHTPPEFYDEAGNVIRTQ